MISHSLIKRLTGGTVLTAALLFTPSQPLFMNKKDPYRALRAPMSYQDKFRSISHSFFKVKKANAAAPDSAVPMNSLRSAVGFVMGYGSRQAYIDFACGGTDPGDGIDCDGPPEEGLVGAMGDMLNLVPTALGAAGVTSCDALPTSGTQAVTISGSSVTVTYATPTQSVPAAWDDGGTAFTKRLEFASSVAGSTVSFAAEFACGVDGILMSINMSVGDHAPGFTRPINVWVGAKSGNQVADVYVAEKNAGGLVRGVYAYHLEVDSASTTYELVGNSTASFGAAEQGMDRVHIHGNYTTNVASIYLRRGVATQVGGGATATLDGAAYATQVGGATDAIVAATAFNLNTATTINHGDTEKFQGCVDFDSPATDPADATLCAGLALSVAPAPVIDAAGNFGSDWVINDMAAALVGIPSL